jgi:hypothetical protein
VRERERDSRLEFFQKLVTDTQNDMSYAHKYEQTVLKGIVKRPIDVIIHNLRILLHVITRRQSSLIIFKDTLLAQIMIDFIQSNVK